MLGLWELLTTPLTCMQGWLACKTCKSAKRMSHKHPSQILKMSTHAAVVARQKYLRLKAEQKIIRIFSIFACYVNGPERLKISAALNFWYPTAFIMALLAREALTQYRKILKHRTRLIRCMKTLILVYGVLLSIFWHNHMLTSVVNHNVIQTIMSYGPKRHTLALPKCHTRFSQRFHFSSLWFYDLLHSVDQHTYALTI